VQHPTRAEKANVLHLQLNSMDGHLACHECTLGVGDLWCRHCWQCQSLKFSQVINRLIIKNYSQLMPEPITFRLAVLAYSSQHNMVPRYLTAQLHLASNVGYRQLLCSSSAMLDVPRTEHVTIGGRAFSLTAARVWNSLPTAVQFSWVTGHFSMPPENWTVRAFLQLTPRLSNDFTAAWLTFTFPTAFCCGRNVEVYRL